MELLNKLASQVTRRLVAIITTWMQLLLCDIRLLTHFSVVVFTSFPLFLLCLAGSLLGSDSGRHIQAGPRHGCGPGPRILRPRGRHARAHAAERFHRWQGNPGLPLPARGGAASGGCCGLPGGASGSGAVLYEAAFGDSWVVVIVNRYTSPFPFRGFYFFLRILLHNYVQSRASPNFRHQPPTKFDRSRCRLSESHV